MTTGSSGVGIELVGMKELRRDFENPKFATRAAVRALDKAAAKTMELAVKRVPVDRGHLKNSITIDRRGEFARAVGSGQPYAKPVEFGSRPHWPPLSALQPWARRHGFPAGRSGAFLVARSIAQGGGKAESGQPFLNPALDDVENNEWPRIRREFWDEMTQAFRKGGKP
jgi:HK97 gp10 family phage protein